MATVHLVSSKHARVLDDDAPVDLRARLGQWLRRAREARGLTVAAVAAQTKIPLGHLEALERGDALGLPAFYQRAEIRTVAHAVGVDEQLALAQLQEALPPVESQRPSPAEPAPHRTAYEVAAVAALIAVVLLGWKIHDNATRNQVRPAVVDQTSGAAVAPPAPQAAPPPAPAQSANVTPVQEAAAAEPAIVEPPAATAPAELVITTQPEGARVTVNGVGWGVSPVIISHLPPGDKRIRVTRNGYAAEERSITIDEGAHEAVRIELAEEAPLPVSDHQEDQQ